MVMQVDRMDTIAAVHDFRVRVVVATDVAARGLDLSAVNLVRFSSPADNATPAGIDHCIRESSDMFIPGCDAVLFDGDTAGSGSQLGPAI